jgi:serine protease Do
VADVSSKDDADEQGSPMERFFRQFGGPNGENPGRNGRHGSMGQGSGFFISSDGYAVTNNHVVEGADKVEVTTDAGKTYTAKVVGTDPRTDLALIKVEGGQSFRLRNFRRARRGLAIGCLQSATRSAWAAP